MNPQLLEQLNHEFVSDTAIWSGKTTYKGIKCQKPVTDLWMYQQLIYRIKPDLIIETGTAAGGTALYMADLLSLINPNGSIVSIDIEPPSLYHPNLKLFKGEANSQDITRRVIAMASGLPRVLVILDAGHTYEHVSESLEIYSPLVTENSYIIVEDTLPCAGVQRAASEFIYKHPEFVVDKECEIFGLSFNPNGYLRKITK